ncbi:MAG: porin family protein, partial [Chlorobiaceae bacterium]|nr:porin family protein [Chlorobiaceae bacterium]
MKKLLLSALTAGLFAVPSMSHAAVNPYASVSGGISLLNKSDLSVVPDMLEWNTGYNVTGALGL